MEHFSSRNNSSGWRLFFASIGPLIPLFAYLFLFRWSERTFLKAEDQGAVIICALLGAMIMAMQPVRLWWRVLGIMCHIVLSVALFGWWRLLSRPVLNDIF